MFAVSWLERQTSSACCSGESSSPNAAWIPPCAFAELQDWSEPFVATATRGPGSLGGDGGGEARGPAADHEHVEKRPPRPSRQIS